MVRVRRGNSGYWNSRFRNWRRYDRAGRFIGRFAPYLARRGLRRVFGRKRGLFREIPRLVKRVRHISRSLNVEHKLLGYYLSATTINGYKWSDANTYWSKMIAYPAQGLSGQDRIGNKIKWSHIDQLCLFKVGNGWSYAKGLYNFFCAIRFMVIWIPGRLCTVPPGHPYIEQTHCDAEYESLRGAYIWNTAMAKKDPEVRYRLLMDKTFILTQERPCKRLRIHTRNFGARSYFMGDEATDITRGFLMYYCVSNVIYDEENPTYSPTVEWRGRCQWIDN